LKLHIVSDWDGVLLDSTLKGMERMEAIARLRLGIPLNGTHRKLIKDLWGKVGVKVFEGAFGVSTESAEEMYAELVEWDKREPFKLVEGTHAALHYFLRIGQPMMVLTSRFRQNIQECLTAYDLHSYFQFAFGCDDCGGEKSFKPVFEKFGTSPRDTVYVGDNFSDVICGRNAGVRTIAVCSGFRSKQEFLDFGVDEKDIIPSIAFFPEWYELNIKS